MEELVSKFPEQLRVGLEIQKSFSLPYDFAPKGVLICGLGGSGIGGTLVSLVNQFSGTCPVEVCKGYFIPPYVSPDFLVIVSSYSGNTEETLSCLDQALEKGARVVCITSGGKMAQKAEKAKLPVALVPGGMPPRACLGYSLVQLTGILVKAGVLPNSVLEDVLSAAILLEKEEIKIKAEAKKLAEGINGFLPVIYSSTLFEGVSIRFRQQLNENAKILCWHHVVPEMNHNELVGWKDQHPEIAIVWLRDTEEYSRNEARIAINLEILQSRTPNVFHVFSQGKSLLEKMIYLIYMGDWASVYLARARNVDPMEVNVIDFLKSELEKKP
jgi:glucose/mannose-6-phosphate isomerase